MNKPNNLQPFEITLTAEPSAREAAAYKSIKHVLGLINTLRAENPKLSVMQAIKICEVALKS